MKNGVNIKTGERFIPYNLPKNGFMKISECVFKSKNLTLAAKCCWMKLAQFAGTNGQCYPSKKILANALGISLSSIHKAVGELKECELIAIKNPSGIERLLHRNNQYYFLWHDIYASCK